MQCYLSFLLIQCFACIPLFISDIVFDSEAAEFNIFEDNSVVASDRFNLMDFGLQGYPFDSFTYGGDLIILYQSFPLKLFNRISYSFSPAAIVSINVRLKKINWLRPIVVASPAYIYYRKIIFSDDLIFFAGRFIYHIDLESGEILYATELDWEYSTDLYRDECSIYFPDHTGSIYKYEIEDKHISRISHMNLAIEEPYKLFVLLQNGEFSVMDAFGKVYGNNGKIINKYDIEIIDRVIYCDEDVVFIVGYGKILKIVKGVMDGKKITGLVAIEGYINIDGRDLFWDRWRVYDYGLGRNVYETEGEILDVTKNNIYALERGKIMVEPH